jgi:hypothetical protein
LPVVVTHLDNQFGLFNVTITHEDGFTHRMSFPEEWPLDDTEMLRFCEENSLIVKDLHVSSGRWKLKDQGGPIVEADQEARTPSTEVGKD